MLKHTNLICCLMLIISSFAQQNTDDRKSMNIGNLVEMSGNWFISYRNGIEQIHADQSTPKHSVEENKFLLKRSYFTLKKTLNDVFSVRYTQDLTVDTEGNDAGNVETRLKYLYLKIKPKINSDLFTGSFVEIGMVHTPWLDYEQKINSYRVQDNMFIERNKIINSADFGVLIGGNVGPEMDKAYLKKVNKAMPGRYMSYALGIFNGGGYSGSEKNNNKMFEGRLSFRPLANNIPELQFSTSFMLGKGNSEDSPDLKQVMGLLGYVGENLVLVAQGHKGTGDFKARYVVDNKPHVALNNNGYSVFGEYKLKNTPFAIWGRYDDFDVDTKNKYDTKRYIGGLTYEVNRYLRIVADYERSETMIEDNDIYELNFEISF